MSDHASMLELERKLRTLAGHAWDNEIHWAHIKGWRNNFTGRVMPEQEEKLHGMLTLSKVMYFSKRLTREMLRSLYRDHFESPLLQRIRRNCGDSLDSELIRRLYSQELLATKFIGVGNPSESGAHLLYFFRQINDLGKDRFADFHGAFQAVASSGHQPTSVGPGAKVSYMPRDPAITRYVFFDDLVASGTQVSDYLGGTLAEIRKSSGSAETRFISLFATSAGLEKLNKPSLFNGNAMALFELDDSYKAFESEARYFRDSPAWVNRGKLREMISGYGEALYPGRGLGFKDGQLLLAFSHNTPDNTPAVFWVAGGSQSWVPVFPRFDKNYGGV